MGDVYNARIIREDDWWAAEITGPNLGVAGTVATESRSIASLEDEVRDIIAIMTDRDRELPYDAATHDFDVIWDCSSLPEPAAKALADFFSAKRALTEAEARYAVATHRAVLDLSEFAHATNRDVAGLMGLSHQRVSQVFRKKAQS